MPQKCKLIDYGLINWSIYMLVLDKDITLITAKKYMFHSIFSYVQYSNIAARVVRKCLKPDLKAEAAKREVVSVKFTKWEGGKPVGM